MNANHDCAVRIGLDWADRSHAYCLLDPASGRLESGSVPHHPAALEAWMEGIETRFPRGRVAVCLEGTRGALMAFLRSRPRVDLHAVNPAAAQYYRKSFRLCGAKNDASDAALLLDLLAKHPDRLRRLSRPDPRDEELSLLCQARRKLADERAKLYQRLGAHLKEYYPQAIEMFGGKFGSARALVFLRRWPDPRALSRARAETVEKAMRRFPGRMPAAVQAFLAAKDRAAAFPVSEAMLSAGRRYTESLVAQIEVLDEHIAGYDQTIAEAFERHPDAALFQSLPGAGKALGPRLLASMGGDRAALASARELSEKTGVAPVLRQSGGSLQVVRRKARPVFEHQSWVEFARHSARFSLWAKAYYDQAKSSGKSSYTALRALAYKWQRVVLRCWQDSVPYDERRYLQSLQKRGSPYAAIAA